MEAAKAGAEKSQAADLVPKSLESARDAELAGAELLQGGQYEKAALKLLESAARYRGTEVEARAESNARAERIRRAEYEKQRNLLLARLDAARQSYEGERAKASEAGAENRAPDKYREARKMAAEAESKADKGDLEGAQKSFENAAGVMQQSRALAADLARAEASHPAKEPPKPAGEITRPAATPQQLISDLLGRYKTAMEDKNIRLLNNLWPSLDRTPQETAISNEFQIARSLQINFQNVEIRVEGESATASGKRLSQIKTFDGRNLRSESNITFKLRKSSGTWIIEAVRFE